MSVFLTFVHIVVCFILIAVILLQAGRGQGLTGAAFGSGNVQSLFGTKAADFLTKATSVIAICFLFTSLGLDFLEVQKSRSLLEVGRKTQSVDVDAIRKALEKVKEQEAATGSETEGIVTETEKAATETEAADWSLSEETETIVADKAESETPEQATQEFAEALPENPEAT